MKIQANQTRPGMVLDHEGRQYAVLKIQIIQPGKGGAFIAVEMRDIKTGTKTNARWRTQDTVEKLNVEERECSFLFGDSDSLTFMDTESYEHFTIPQLVWSTFPLLLRPPTSRCGASNAKSRSLASTSGSASSRVWTSTHGRCGSAMTSLTMR